MTQPRPSDPPIWVVKIGGSLWSGAELKPWLATLAAVRCARIVVVPGGGPFADVVRATQPRIGFGDAAAHRMAILGMEQYAHALLDLEPALEPASTFPTLRESLGAVVWIPSILAASAPLPESWAVTSDSLAAWLAGALGAARVILLKSAALPPGPVAIGDLCAAGILDEAMPGLAAAARYEIRCVESGQRQAFAAACEAGAAFGTLVLPDGQARLETRPECLSTSCS